MRRHAYLLLIGLLTGTAALAIIAMFAADPGHQRLPKTPPRPEDAAQKVSPSLHCLFSDFTHASVVVGFDFAVAFSKGSLPRFAERAEAVRGDPEVDFDAGNRPVWSYAIDEGTPTITSPKGETRIVLYGLKLGVSDASWIEAGIRSNEYRNLDGRCFQAHFPESLPSSSSEH